MGCVECGRLLFREELPIGGGCRVCIGQEIYRVQRMTALGRICGPTAAYVVQLRANSTAALLARSGIAHA